MTTRRHLGWALLLSSLALLAVPTTGIANDVGNDPLEARAFEIRYRPLAEVVDVVNVLLSPEGRTTVRPHSRTLVVEDRLSVLRKVKSLIEDFDLPPRSFEVTLVLFLGSDTEAASAGDEREFSQEVRGVMEKVSKFTKWQTYELVGSRSINGVEGTPIQADFADRYRVEFLVGSVHEYRGTTQLKFDRISLKRRLLDDAGAVRLEDLYTASMVLKVGSQKILGAASDPNSKQALFLTLQARAEAPGR